MSKSLLLICRRSPWSGLAAREMLDIALAGGAFDLPISLLFLDDGVLQLASGQQSGQIQQKSLTANLQALPLFGVEHLYACHDSLVQRGLQQEDCALVELLQVDEIRALLARHDQVITL